MASTRSLSSAAGQEAKEQARPVVSSRMLGRLLWIDKNPPTTTTAACSSALEANGIDCGAFALGESLSDRNGHTFAWRQRKTTLKLVAFA